MSNEYQNYMKKRRFDAFEDISKIAEIFLANEKFNLLNTNEDYINNYKEITKILKEGDWI